ncbi:MAG TPA: L,D-transpeptidase [Actinophytocola sp.]|uniref:L,D-transpeptidase n=1 Tax=Actinophytocola sp. TaxID=1872138 RepID=UPI002DDD503B|nr:L,D-transpeptidase [Actinophytocola sp.]HEV2779546.1 L,D-transpeptidase [Actinophytocola sp.]
MRIKLMIVGVAGLAALSACGTGNAASSGGPSAEPPTSTTTTTTVAPTTTTTTTTTPPPPPPPTTTKPKPTTTKPKPKPAPAAGTPCSISDGACIDLSANKSWLLSGGKVTYGPVPITHGRKGYRTPPGTFRVQFKDIDHKSSLFDDAPMPYSVFFNGGIAFHEGSLREQSHGCIHLSRAAAKTYYNTLKVGSTVQVVP